jgi:hypothetical protein
MCRRIECEQCQKPTYAGCGKHVEQVLRGVNSSDRCSCREQASLAHVQLTHLAYKPSAILEQR